MFIALLTATAALAQDSATISYEQKIDMVYGEVHGTGLLMDVFTPKGKSNGLAVIDVVSGAFFPHFSRNLQTGALEAESAVSRPARIFVHHSARYPSRVVLPVTP